jgi:hypothetical protein
VKLFKTTYVNYFLTHKTRYYDDIEEIPAMNYLKMKIEGDLKQLIKGKIKVVNFLTIKKINDSFIKINDQVRAWKGIEREERILINMKIKALKHMQRAILEDNPNEKIFAKVMIQKIDKKVNERGQGSSVYDTIFAHKKGMGQSSDYKVMSAKEFLSDLDNLNKIYGESN